MTQNYHQQEKIIRRWITFFIVALALSGLTALVIAIVFIGPLRDPVRNKWIIEFGMIASVLVFPLAFIAGAVRGIPIYWRLIDCSFGVIGLIPLAICYKKIRILERLSI